MAESVYKVISWWHEHQSGEAAAATVNLASKSLRDLGVAR